MTAPRTARSSRRRTVLCRLGACLGASLADAASAAQSHFDHPIRLIVPFTPGGSTDILARALAPSLQQALGQPVLVENRPGAGGSIGAAEVARAKADGHTLLMGHIGTLAVNPALYPKLPYDSKTAFAPVAAIARVPNVLVVAAGMPARSFDEFIKRARAEPGRMTFSSGGNGSAAHISFEYLKQRTGIDLRHVPYRGTAPSLSDVIAGHVDATFTGVPTVLAQIRSGRLRALAVSSAQRLPALPAVPTVAESGVPGFEADQWYGVVAPAATPPERVARLNAEIIRALAQADVMNALAAEGAVAIAGTPAAFGELIAAETTRWAKVVSQGRLTPD